MIPFLPLLSANSYLMIAFLENKKVWGFAYLKIDKFEGINKFTLEVVGRVFAVICVCVLCGCVCCVCVCFVFLCFCVCVFVFALSLFCV